jgi:hypothetical protein
METGLVLNLSMRVALFSRHSYRKQVELRVKSIRVITEVAVTQNNLEIG